MGQITNQSFFSDREGVNADKTLTDKISSDIWKGIFSIYKKYLANNNFAKRFPLECPDGNGIYGTQETLFANHVAVVIPGFKIDERTTPLSLFTFDDKDVSEIKFSYCVLDFIEFMYLNLTDAEEDHYHDYRKHYELKFPNTHNAQKTFIEDINTLFFRQHIAYKLTNNGKIERVLSDLQLHQMEQTKQSTDCSVNELIKEAFIKIRDPKFKERKIGLERLWDAFERIKSFYATKQDEKKHSLEDIINKITQNDTNWTNIIDDECDKLRKIGNNGQIRHFETYKFSLANPIIIDYLFFRMLATINLLLTGCISSNSTLHNPNTNES